MQNNNFTFIESFEVVLIKMISILTEKLATLGFLKINVFWKMGYDVVISVHAPHTKCFRMSQIKL